MVHVSLVPCRRVSHLDVTFTSCLAFSCWASLLIECRVEKRDKDEYNKETKKGNKRQKYK